MRYSILINTCDKFDDCWNPFFTLFKKYWSDCSAAIYLNTEFKDYAFPGLNIIPVKGCEGKTYKGRYATWSQCLKWALDTIETDIVLYMQEDYFLKAPVQNEVFEGFVTLMEAHHEIKCIHLTDQAVTAVEKSSYNDLNIVQLKQRYRVSCQAALWRKDELLRIIREYENAWEFEEFGSQRSTVLGSQYLCVSRDIVKLNVNEIIPYIFTGIIQGRWYEEVIPLFKANNIEVDYSKRGMVKDAPKKPISKRIQYRIEKTLKIIRKEIDLFNLRKSLRKAEY